MWVGAGWGVSGGGCHTGGYFTVVAAGARSGNIRMIKAAVRCQLQKTGGIVAVIAFGVRECMKFRHTDGHDIIMTPAAISKNFLMIDEGDNGKILRGMAGLARITGSNVIRYFMRKKIAGPIKVYAIVTIPAI